MLKEKKVALKGFGDMCSRSRSATIFQSDMTEFEKELLEAIGSITEDENEIEFVEEEQFSCNLIKRNIKRKIQGLMLNIPFIIQGIFCFS